MTDNRSSNSVLAKWGKHRLACPSECMECEMRAEIERLTRDVSSAQASWNAACQDIERLTRELAKERDNASHEMRRWKADANERDRLRALVQRAHTIIGIREAAHQTHKGAAWLEQATRELNGEPEIPDETSAEFEGCHFVGTPPLPFTDWNSWAASAPRRGVTIRASENGEGD